MPSTSLDTRQAKLALHRGWCSLRSVQLRIARHRCSRVRVRRDLAPSSKQLPFSSPATSLVVFGFDESMVRAVSRVLASGEVHALRRTLLVALVPLLALAGVVAIVVWKSGAPEVGRLLHGEDGDGGLAGYLRILVIALPFTAMYYALLASTRGFGTMVPTVAIERVGRPFAQALGAGIVVAVGASVNMLTLIWALPFVVGSFLAAWQLHGLIGQEYARSSRDSAPPRVLDLAREFWRFSSLRGVASIFQTTFLWLDTLDRGRSGLRLGGCDLYHQQSNGSSRLPCPSGDDPGRRAQSAIFSAAISEIVRSMSTASLPGGSWRSRGRCTSRWRSSRLSCYGFSGATSPMGHRLSPPCLQRCSSVRPWGRWTWSCSWGARAAGI